MVAAVILENRKIAVSRPQFYQFQQNLTQWQGFTLLSIPTVKISKISKSKTEAAAILENRQIAISRPQFDQFQRNLTQWQSFTLLSVPTVKISKISKSKMAAAAILKNRKIAISRPRFDSDFDEIWHGDAVSPLRRCKLRFQWRVKSQT